MMFLQRLSLIFSRVVASGSGFNPALPLSICKTTYKQELWKYTPFTSSRCDISTSALLTNHKKVGLYLFGRPPKPNINVEQSSSLVAVEGLDPASYEALEKLFEAEFPRDIFNIYEEYKPYLTEIHISRALQKLADVWDVSQANVPTATDGGNALVTVEPAFRDLCRSCLREAQHMDDTSFLLSLRALLRINVPENSALIHTLLSHSQHRINQMSPVDLAIFCQVLDSLKLSSELSQALHKAVVFLVPKMIPKAESTWQLVAFMKTVGRKLSPMHRGKLLHKVLAFMKLDPSITAEDCYSVLVALKYSNIQSEQLVKEVCKHLQECFQDLSDTQICDLFMVLCHFEYLDVNLMDKLCNFVCQYFENFNDEYFSKVFNGLTAAKFVHRELAKLGCRYVVEKSSDQDLMVELPLVASIAKYCLELNLKPEVLENFFEHAACICESYFQQDSISLGSATFQALDIAYSRALLSECYTAQQLFEDCAIRCLQGIILEGRRTQNFMLQVSLYHYLKGVFMYETHQSILESNRELSLPNPWHGTQCANIALEKRLVLKETERFAGRNQYQVDVDVHQGLKTDILILPSKEDGQSAGVVVNILPKEGKAVNEKDHLVGLYHLKDKVLKHLGYKTLWVDAGLLTTTDVDGRKIPLENCSHNEPFLRKFELCVKSQ